VKVCGDPYGKIRKAAEHISIARYQLRLSGLDVGQRSKTVNLQFKDELIGIERLWTAGKPYGA
jgi:hypothetical protein